MINKIHSIQNYLTIKKIKRDMSYSHEGFEESHVITEKLFIDSVLVEPVQQRTGKQKFLSVIIASTFLFLFFYFFIGTLLLESLSFIGVFMLISLDICFIIVAFQFSCVLFNNFAEDSFNYKSLTLNIIPVSCIAIVFFFVFVLNDFLRIVVNINYVTQDPVLIFLPIFILAYFGFFLAKSIISHSTMQFTINASVLKHKNYSDEMVRFKFKIISHVKFSLLIVFLCLTISQILYFGPLITIIILILFIGTWNALYFVFADFFIDIKIDKEKESDLNKEKYKQGKKTKRNMGLKKDIGIVKKFTGDNQGIKKTKVIHIFLKKMRTMVPLGYTILFIFLIMVSLFLIFDIFNGNLLLIRMYYIFTTNSLVVALFLTNLAFFMAYPLIKLSITPLLIASKKIYEKKLIKYFRTAFMFIVLLFVLKILVFNIKESNINWLASSIVSLIVSIISNKLRTFRKIVT